MDVAALAGAAEKPESAMTKECVRRSVGAVLVLQPVGPHRLSPVRRMDG